MKDAADQSGGKRLNFEIKKTEAECLSVLYFHLWRNESRGGKKKNQRRAGERRWKLACEKRLQMLACVPVYVCSSVCARVSVCLLFFFFFRSPHQCACVGKGESRETWTRAQ